MFKKWSVGLAVASVITWFALSGLASFERVTHAQDSRPVESPPTLKWEQLGNEGGPSGAFAYRAKVPGGWLVHVHTQFQRSREALGIGAGTTFVPDTHHEW